MWACWVDFSLLELGWPCLLTVIVWTKPYNVCNPLAQSGLECQWAFSFLPYLSSLDLFPIKETPLPIKDSKIQDMYGISFFTHCWISWHSDPANTSHPSPLPKSLMSHNITSLPPLPMTQIRCRASHCWQEQGKIIAQRHTPQSGVSCPMSQEEEIWVGPDKTSGPKSEHGWDSNPRLAHSCLVALLRCCSFWRASRQLIHWTVNWPKTYDVPGAVLSTGNTVVKYTTNGGILLLKTFQIHLKLQLLRVVPDSHLAHLLSPNHLQSHNTSYAGSLIIVYHSFPGFSLPLNCRLHQGPHTLHLRIL